MQAHPQIMLYYPRTHTINRTHIIIRKYIVDRICIFIRTCIVQDQAPVAGGRGKKSPARLPILRYPPTLLSCVHASARLTPGRVAVGTRSAGGPLRGADGRPAGRQANADLSGRDTVWRLKSGAVVRPREWEAQVRGRDSDLPVRLRAGRLRRYQASLSVRHGPGRRGRRGRRRAYAPPPGPTQGKG